jgi:riboflavin kinase / FMN adenylyltransferase
MQHFWAIEGVQLNDSWVTIGSFDGVHRGHQKIVSQLTAGAHAVGAPAVVLTFYPHPSYVLGKRSGPYYLTTPEERASLLGELGADFVMTHPFTRDFAALTAREFIERLHSRVKFSKLLVGYDFALGRGREGDVAKLGELGKEYGYSVDVFSPIEEEGQVISSSQIRQLLLDGEADQAARLLGRPYRVAGWVGQGDKRGRRLGIPTANLEVWEQMVVPKPGVYACRALFRGKQYQAVTNVGLRPTIADGITAPRIEAHLLEFDDDIYDQTLRLDFVQRLRDEQRFPDLEALVAQIHRDIAAARKIFSAVQDERGEDAAVPDFTPNRS